MCSRSAFPQITWVVVRGLCKLQNFVFVIGCSTKCSYIIISGQSGKLLFFHKACWSERGCSKFGKLIKNFFFVSCPPYLVSYSIKIECKSHHDPDKEKNWHGRSQRQWAETSLSLSCCTLSYKFENWIHNSLHHYKFPSSSFEKSSSVSVAFWQRLYSR